MQRSAPVPYHTPSSVGGRQRLPQPMASEGAHTHTHPHTHYRQPLSWILFAVASATFTGRPDECGPEQYKAQSGGAAADGIELRACQSSARVPMGCTIHSLYRHGGNRSGMVCLRSRRSKTRVSGQIRTVRRAHRHVRVLTARQANSVRALLTAGRDAAEGATAWLRDSVNPEGRLGRDASTDRRAGNVG
jgi:hypothetical protein